MDFRLVLPEDNEQLIRLFKATPWQGGLNIRIDRAPDFFAFPAQYGPCLNHLSDNQIAATNVTGWIGACAEDAGVVRGAMFLFLRRGQYEGKKIRILIPADAVVEPPFQRQGISRHLAEFLFERWGAQTADLLITYLPAGAVPAAKLLAKTTSSLGKIAPMGGFHIIQLSMYRPYRTSRLDIRRATQEDAPAIRELVLAHGAKYHFGPDDPDKSLKTLFQRSPGYDWKDFQLLHDDGKLQALIGLWDHHRIRRIIADKFPLRLRWGVRLGSLVNLVLKSPKPPQTLKHQTSLFIKHMAHRPGKEHLLCAMLKNIVNETRTSKRYNYIWGAYYDSDPMLKIFDSMQFTSLRSEQHCLFLNPSWKKTPFEVESQPCYADFSMI